MCLEPFGPRQRKNRRRQTREPLAADPLHRHDADEIGGGKAAATPRAGRPPPATTTPGLGRGKRSSAERGPPSPSPGARACWRGPTFWSPRAPAVGPTPAPPPPGPPPLRTAGVTPASSAAAITTG